MVDTVVMDPGGFMRIRALEDDVADLETGKASTDVATPSVNGLMSATDKSKLNGVAAGATANDTDAALRARSSHTGTQSADTVVDGTTNKAFTAGEKTKLAGVASGATANDTNANLRDRSTHTGSQSADTVTDGTTNKAYTAGEKTKLAGVATAATANQPDATLKARANHTGEQAIATVTGLQGALDDRALNTALAANAAARADYYGPQMISFEKAIVWDYAGVHGSPNTIYVPRKFYLKRASQTVNKIATGWGTADSKLTDYVKLTLGADGVYLIYADLSDTTDPYKAVYVSGALPAETANYVLIATVNKWEASSPHAIARTQSGVMLFPYSPIIIDSSGIALMPRVIYRDESGGSVDWQSDVAGQVFNELDLSGAFAKFVWFDYYAAKAGLNPWKVTTYATAPFLPGESQSGLLFIGTMFNGVFSSPYPHTTSKPNLFAWSSRDGAPILQSGTVYQAVTDPVLTALGFTGGYSNPAGGALVYYGDYLPEPLNSGYVFARVFVLSDTDDSFQNVNLFLIPENAGNINGGQMMVAKRHSARVREYVGWATVAPGQKIIGVFLGISGSGSRVYTITGGQFTTGGDREVAVNHNDYMAGYDTAAPARALHKSHTGASASALLMASDIYAVRGRPLTLIPGNMVPGGGRRFEWSFTSWSDDLSAPPLIREGVGDTINLDTNHLQRNCELVLRDQDARYGSVSLLPITAHIADGAVTGTKKGIIIGDSLVERAVAVMTSRKTAAAATGATVTWLGTMSMSQDSLDTGVHASPQVMGEGRSGWQFADFIYANDRFPSIAPGGEATYLAGNTTTKRGLNPFVRVATSTEINADDPRIRNGHIFDMGAYSSRFLSGQVADFAVIDLGRNDISGFDDATSLTYITDGINIIVDALLAWNPAIKIAIGIEGQNRSTDIDTDFQSGETYAAIRKILQIVKTRANAQVRALPLWAMLSRKGGQRWTVASTDAVTGVQKASSADNIHYWKADQHLKAEAITAFALAAVAGV